MSRSANIALAGLVIVHLAVALAGFLTPHGFESQNRDLPYAPPTRIHLTDAEATGDRGPFVYGLEAQPDGSYREDRTRRYTLEFFAHGEPYRLLGVVPATRRLVTVEAPGRLFLLGTDGLGRDLFSRLLFGGRVSLFAGLLGATIALFVGTVVGTLSGYYGGRVDRLLMGSTEIFMALPWLYLLIAARAVQPLDVPPLRAFLIVILILGLFGWPRTARLLRGVAMSAREREFVHAARGFGASDLHLMTRHVLPQAAPVALTQGALLVPQFILAEVALSFLGVGIRPPTPSWGNMLNELQRYHVLTSSWWWIAAPAICLIGLILAYQALARGATVAKS